MGHSASDQPDTSKMTRVPPPAPPVGPPARPSYPPSPNPLLRTPLPPTQQLQPDTLRQYYRHGVPQTRIVPLPPTANATINASAKGVATTVAKTVIATTPGAPGQITLNVPGIFTPLTQTVTLPGPLNVGLAPEPVHTFWAAPIPGLTSLTGTFTNSYSVRLTPNTHPTITFTPPSAGWALYTEALAGTSTTPTGWTAWGDMGALSISSTSPITATDGVGNSLSWCNGVVTFSGAIPTLVANHQANLAFPGTGGPFQFIGTASLTITPTAGNFLIVSVHGSVAAGNGNSLGGVSISDSVGDVFSQVVSVGAAETAFTGATSLITQIAPSVVGGSTTINASVSGKFSAGVSFLLSVTEVTPFAVGAGLPVFRPIASTDLPGITASQISSGIVPLNFGGTGADLHGTGGVSKFLSQATSGATVTVVRPDFSDLAGATGQLATSYNGVSLVSGGIPSEVATVDLTAQTATKTTTTLYAVPATGAGQYRLAWNAKVTTADAVSSTLGALTIVYTDPDAVVQTITAAAQNKNGTIETSDTGNTTTTAMLGVPMMLNCKASTNITYAMAYTSNTPATMAYNLHVKLEGL